MNSGQFANRVQAGKKLAEYINGLSVHADVVYALPRGGVPVAAEVAKALHTPLDIVVVKKVHHPAHPEYGVGAISELETEFIDRKRARGIGMDKVQIKEAVNQQMEELTRRVSTFKQDGGIKDLTGKSVIVVDDGIATGVTAITAALALRKRNPKTLTFAAPVCSHQSKKILYSYYDHVICLMEDRHLYAVGYYYRDFHQVSDEEVISCLASA